jgi:adenosylmethionine-8-amino-7-oxononanoate aminotransferase
MTRKSSVSGLPTSWKKILEVGVDNVGAFIAEPIQGAGGVIIPPDTYWPRIKEILAKYDILFVADEVICGFGRTGEWFGSDFYDLKPDMMTIAKGLTSGYIPMGGLIVRDEVVAVLNEGGDFNHGFTYSGHPVAAAVAWKTSASCAKKNYRARAQRNGTVFAETSAGTERSPVGGRSARGRPAGCDRAGAGQGHSQALRRQGRGHDLPAVLLR